MFEITAAVCAVAGFALGLALGLMVKEDRTIQREADESKTLLFMESERDKIFSVKVSGVVIGDDGEPEEKDMEISYTNRFAIVSLDSITYWDMAPGEIIRVEITRPVIMNNLILGDYSTITSHIYTQARNVQTGNWCTFIGDLSTDKFEANGNFTLNGTKKKVN